MKIAIIGASGFIGTRFVESLVLGGKHEIVPVVRSFASLAVLARFDLPWKVCDIMEPEQVAGAVRGCDVVVHAALGDAAQIVNMAEAIYRGANQAGVRRLVALSSATVYGFAPPPETTDETPPNPRQGIGYNDAKARAELVLEKLRARGQTELVTLRPGIVYGPRSRFVVTIVQQLISGTAYLVREGRGVCNAIYVDNMCAAMLKAAESEGVNGQNFMVGDEEKITWREFYAALAAVLGKSMEDVHEVEAPAFRRSMAQRIDSLVGSSAVQAVLPLFPRAAKDSAKKVISALNQPPPAPAWRLPDTPGPQVAEDICALQQGEWKPSHEKARRLLGYRPGLTFAQGMERTARWLEFAGYPVVAATNA